MAVYKSLTEATRYVDSCFVLLLVVTIKWSCAEIPVCVADRSVDQMMKHISMSM